MYEQLIYFVYLYIVIVLKSIIYLHFFFFLPRFVFVVAPYYTVRQSEHFDPIRFL